MSIWIWIHGFSVQNLLAIRVLVAHCDVSPVTGNIVAIISFNSDRYILSRCSTHDHSDYALQWLKQIVRLLLN